jgi:hypothetical protein
MQRSRGTVLLVAAVVVCLSACSADSTAKHSHALGGAAAVGGGGAAGAGFGNGLNGNGDGSGLGSGAAGNGMFMGKGCATADIITERQQPIIVLVIDGSGSMCAPFGNATRWTALRSALMDPDGVVTKLQAAVQFGMVMYDGTIDLAMGVTGGAAANVPQCSLQYALNQPAGKACPNITIVGAALNNQPALAAMYPMTELGGSTPTHYALGTTMDGLLMANMQTPDGDKKPMYVVLATDGQPNDFCNSAAMLNPEQEVINQVTRGAMAGIKTFVISLAGDDMALQAHLQQVAMAGGTGQPPFTPMNKDDLVSTFVQIIGGAIGCQVTLNGKVSPGGECMGYVQVNGANLPCNDPNGWHLKDERTVELQGSACMDFLNNPLAQLHADFPCGVFVPD